MSKMSKYSQIAFVGVSADERNCDPRLRPIDRQTCIAPCPQDCDLSTWGPWTSCSATCGNQAYKVRHRRVTEMPMYGGKACPVQVNKDGSVFHQDCNCKICENKSDILCHCNFQIYF